LIFWGGVLFLFIYFWQYWHFELTALHLLSRSSTSWSTPPVLFCCSYFSGRIWHFFARATFKTQWSCLCLPNSWNTGEWHHTSIVLWDCLPNSLPVGLKLQSSYLHLPSSWNYRYEAQPLVFQRCFIDAITDNW
jgi:hypothetical protein